MWTKFTSGPGSVRWGVLAKAILAVDGCLPERWCDTGRLRCEILAWLANHEPETCAVITGLITRANTAGSSGRFTLSTRQERETSLVAVSTTERLRNIDGPGHFFI
jgi:hypothetical protein